MMVDTLPNLIDKQDGFEYVRDQIALILATESSNQVNIASVAGKPDPSLWNLRVFTERSNPWEQELNRQDQVEAGSPIVNVWYSNGVYEQGSSSTVTGQKLVATYNIDIYGFGTAEKKTGRVLIVNCGEILAQCGEPLAQCGESVIKDIGQINGDEAAAFASHRGVRFVRNILMAAINTYLQLRDENSPVRVWQRFIRSADIFQPKLDNNAVQKVVAARLQIDVSFNETAPQVEGQNLELISVDITRASDGQILAEADYIGV